jgi:hypothetical protein
LRLPAFLADPRTNLIMAFEDHFIPPDLSNWEPVPKAQAEPSASDGVVQNEVHFDQARPS